MPAAVVRFLPAVLLAFVLSGAGCAGRSAAVAPVDPGSVRTVRAALLNMLECPSLGCANVEDLHAGQKVAVLTPDMNGWYQVRVLADGREGYVLARFLGR